MTLDLVCIVRNYIPTTKKARRAVRGIWPVGIRACAGYELPGLCVRFAPIIKCHRVKGLGGPLWPPRFAN